MDDFKIYVKMGLNHVLDFSAYDHIIFLVALAVVFSVRQWKKVLWLVTLFTLGHSLTLGLSAYAILKIRVDVIEFLIPVTIFITGLINIINTKNNSNQKDSINLWLALFFGLIHGLGFSNYFRMMIGQEEDKLLPLVEFALGIELAQIIIVLSILALGYLFQELLKIKKNIWVISCSAIVILIALKMMSERVFW